jgi:hypothetical protein
MIALWRSYSRPFITLVALTFVPPVARIALAVARGNLGPIADALGAAFLSGVFTLQMAADIFAILYFGTGLALTSKRPNLATAWTIFFVLILPGPFAFCWIDILVDLVFISWGSQKCHFTNLRRLVTQQYEVIASPPALFGPSPPTAIPPRIHP